MASLRDWLERLHRWGNPTSRFHTELDRILHNPRDFQRLERLDAVWRLETVRQIEDAVMNQLPQEITRIVSRFMGNPALFDSFLSICTLQDIRGRDERLRAAERFLAQVDGK